VAENVLEACVKGKHMLINMGVDRDALQTCAHTHTGVLISRIQFIEVKFYL
jgi:hypothetical protein